MLATPAIDLPVQIVESVSPLTVLSVKDLQAVVAQPPSRAARLSTGPLTLQALANSQNGTAGVAGITASAANSGFASTNQAMVSISFTLTQAPAVKPGR